MSPKSMAPWPFGWRGGSLVWRAQNRTGLPSPELLWGLLGGKRQVRWGVIMGWDRDWNRQFS